MIGVLFFLGGFVVPFVIQLVAGIAGVDDGARYHITFYSILIGALSALLLGLPLIVISLFMNRVGRNSPPISRT
ncbi:MAG TPA: hypothetical protein VM870_11605 [Pyrinomonadaceae bacterium]|nr:hypothetical protein [Pyrinomonadaceae bacterium]